MNPSELINSKDGPPGSSRVFRWRKSPSRALKTPLLDAEASGPRRICFVTTVATTLETFVLPTAKYLHEVGGYEITFVCDNLVRFSTPLPDYIDYFPVRMHRGKDLSALRAIIGIARILRMQRVDLIQYSTPNAALYASIAGWICRVPVRLYCQWGIRFVTLTGPARRFYQFIELATCRLSSFVQPDSFGNLDLSRRIGLYQDRKSSVIWNGSASGVDTEKFAVSHRTEWRQEIRAALSIPPQAFTICFVGRLSVDKGADTLLRAASSLLRDSEDFYLVLVGPEESEGLDSKLIQWTNSNARVRRCGPTDAVEKYLAASDVLTLPSLREGFGSVVIEAEAMGLPVVVSDIPGPRDAMIHGVTGYHFPAGDALALKDAIVALHRDPPLRAQMSEAAVRFAVSKFEAREFRKRVLADREKLISSARARSLAQHRVSVLRLVARRFTAGSDRRDSVRDWRTQSAPLDGRPPAQEFGRR